MPSYFFHLLFELYDSRSPYCKNLPELSHLTKLQLSSLPLWIPPPGTDIFAGSLPVHSKGSLSTATFKHGQKKSKSKEKEFDRHPDWRFGPVSVELIDMAPATSSLDVTLSAGTAAPKARFVPLETANTEFGYGVVHLYRDAHETPGANTPKAEIGDLDDDALKTVAILAVPSYMSPSDFMGFVGEGTRDTVSHLRMVRTGKANRYMVLMRFRDKEGARQFVADFNGKVFNSMEPENCHVVYVKSIQFTSPSSAEMVSQGHQPGVFPEISNDPFSPSHSPGPVEPSTSPSTSTVHPLSTTAAHPLSTKPAPPPTPSLSELPTCPVCLERMDETTGLLTILCQHVFHCACLSKWKDSSCPVCRYTQSSHPLASGSDASEDEEDSCNTCGATQNLWICLICGNVGCGRYDDAHAFEHYKTTSHCYAMDIETQRVWDYIGDGYVHRLIQNKSDGKLVELPSALMSSEHSGEEDLVPRAKLENIGMEYTYLLTSQLESQRQYFEEKIALAADKASSAAANAEKSHADATAAIAGFKEVQEKYNHLALEVVPGLEKAKDRAETKAQKFAELAKKMEKEWKEEKGVSEGLLERVKFLDKENEARTKEVNELKEQVRDLMFFLQAREKMEDVSEDVQEGTITIGDAPKEDAKGKGKRKKGKGKR
ncbi:putative RING and UBP finger domain protein [Sphaerosporella brunnea]|uniref:Putative RING and UBP finger domain protein n=1 Tax=Sphaerosporella brunnea TaxID=1250544 RepID=A0A5J5EX59_9PEZI|nr:putative RING and UBP finger domain protein [Sphaerosporella brunnea]